MSSNSTVSKRSVVIDGHRTSISIEDDFWAALKQIAGARQMTLANLVREIDLARERGNLSSAIRVHVLRHYWLTHPQGEEPAAAGLLRSY